jgi:FAD/FMN-containing dehydrogenase
LKDGAVLLTERLNRFLAFDEKTGVLNAEAGVTIADILKTFVPRGWFPSVTPGTKFASLGGCVAADVHGKNHHRAGAFSEHVEELELVLADGSRRRCSRHSAPDLFWSTVGGMGLTGIIVEVAFRLRPIETAYIVVENHRATDLDSMFDLLESEALDDETSVAWIDCLAPGVRQGRGIMMCGHHATRSELPKHFDDPLRIKARREPNLPFDFPSWVLNRRAMASFNELYYLRQGRQKSSAPVDYNSYFYPLDSIGHWNRMYGSRGFVQYQCVLPAISAHQGTRRLLEALAQERQPSYLGVLKRFGDAGAGLLSFPLPGYTLVLELPISNQKLFPFLRKLDEIVIRYGGRVYLAKDARLKAEAFRSMYSGFDKWRKVKASVDPRNCFSSDLSRRLEMWANG